MELLQAYRFKARPTPEQEAYFRRIAGCCRVLYNAALEQRKLAYRQRRVSVRYTQQSAELKALKEAFPWISEAPHHCLQGALRDLQAAFKNFFEGRASYPRFRKKHENDSFRFPDANQIELYSRSPKRKRGRIFLPKVKDLSFIQHRSIEGELCNVTVTREADGWYVSILTRREVPEPTPVMGDPVGIDLGVVNTVTLSGGQGRFCVPGFSEGEAKRLVRLQQKLARQQKGSGSRAKTKHQIASLHARVRRRRVDVLHKLSYRLTREHSVIVVEDLNIKNMTASAKGTLDAPGKNVRQKAGLNRSILAQGWGEFRRQLLYKSRWHGSTYQPLSNFAFSSQACARCGHVSRGNRRSQSDFACVQCGYAVHADENAADVILARGLRVTAGGACSVRAVKPEFQEGHASLTETAS